MEEKRDRTEFYVGLFVFFGLVLLGTLILTFGSVGKLFRKTYDISVVFENVQSLREGAPVVRGGLTIGYVTETPSLRKFDQISVPLSIYDEYKVPSNARFRIDTAGLMGDTFVSILPPEDSELQSTSLNPGDSVDGSTGTGFNELSDETIVVLKKIQKGLDDLNVMLNKVDDDILTSENIENIQTSVASLNSTAIKFEERYINDVNAENINEILTSLKHTAQKLSEVVESLPPILEETSETVKTIGPSVERFAGEATKTAQGFSELAESLQALSDDVRSSDGALPMLLHDAEVRDNLKALIYNLRVKGLLWYKDVAPESGSTQSQSPKENKPRRSLFPLRKKSD